MVTLGVDENGGFIRLKFRVVARLGSCVFRMGREEERVFGTQIDECREVEGRFELMVTTAPLALCPRG